MHTVQGLTVMRVALLLVSLMLMLIVPVSGEEEAFVMTQSIQDGKL